MSVKHVYAIPDTRDYRFHIYFRHLWGSVPSFHLSKDNTLPDIMMGPCTVIAPFRSFRQKRKIDRDMLPVPHKQDKLRSGWGGTYLYFGCHKSQVNNIYRGAAYGQGGRHIDLTNVYTAFSKEIDKSMVTS